MSNQTNINVQPLFDTGALADGDKSKAAGEWMSVQEASNATGLSMGTLRRYIKSGKIKARRRGRTTNSKLEVLVTQDLLPDQPGQSDYFGTEEEGDEDDDFIEVDQADQPDQHDQPMQATLAWMREKLDEKDALLKEKESKIETLARELAGATYRNAIWNQKRTTTSKNCCS